MAFTENLGRYFLFAGGFAVDAGPLGAVVLLILLGLALLEMRQGRPEHGRALLWALAFYVVANLPASLFAGESSRHHAYLPAMGAAPVYLFTVLLLPRRAWEIVLALLFAIFFVSTLSEQKLWMTYLDHSESVRESSLEVFDESPVGQRVACLNMPFEYRAAFVLRWQGQEEIAKWPDFCVMTTRKSWLPPKGVSLPEGDAGLWVEYDGKGLRRGRLADLARRTPAPRAWFHDVLRPFPEPVLRWGQILDSEEPLQDLPWSQSPRVGRGLPARPADASESGTGKSERLRIDKEEFGSPTTFVYAWEVETRTTDWRWLVLGWSPLSLPTTENVGLFTLKTLPWLFEARVIDRDTGDPLEIEVLPVLGLLPALRLPPGQHSLRVELTLR
jgi:hypothetical protein